MSIYHTHMEINGVEDVPICVHYSFNKEGHIGIERVEGPDACRDVELTTAQEAAMEEEISYWLGGRFDQPEPEDCHEAN